MSLYHTKVLFAYFRHMLRLEFAKSVVIFQMNALKFIKIKVLGIFGLQYSNTFFIFEISTFAFS